MVQSVLGSLILGYRPLWNRARKLAGIQLYAQNEAATVVDAAHLLRTVQEMWSSTSPPLLLSAQTRQLLCSLLDDAPRGAPWIEVRGDWLSDSAILARVKAAHQRGLKMVWRGDLARLPGPEVARCFDNSLLSLRPEDAVAALQTAPTRPGGPAPVAHAKSPVLAGQMYENITSRALMEHCLDQQNALALAGWPAEDMLYHQRHQAPQPSHAVIFKLMKAIDAEQSLETFEEIMGEDPLLAYRFMVYTNSAALGLRTGIDSLRRGLVMMGYGSIKRWLSDQLPHASTDLNLRPVRESMLIRAQLMTHLLDAGVEGLVIFGWVAEGFVVVQLHEERNAVGIATRNRGQHAVGRGHAVTARFNRQLNNVLRIEVERVRRKRGARRVLNALVNRQNRKISCASQTPGVVQRLHIT